LKALEHPFVTAVVATRGRPLSVAEAAEAILANDYPNFELIIVDQGSGDRQTTFLKRYLDDPRLHLTVSEQDGISPARNTGITQAQGEILAITDDDCEVPSHWLLRLVNAFSKASQIGIVFGNVLPANHDSSAGFIPAYVRESPIIVSNIYKKHQADGIGACMGVRKAVWQDLGGFDEMFGVGAPLKSNS
jgi:glycosyltransferase involved in cell wall biosynthesis